MKKLVLLAAVCACLKIYAQKSSVSRPDTHAPIGVMGDHTHTKGEFMISYRFMSMPMEDNLVGTDKISSDEIVTEVENVFGTPATLRVVPERMSMNMHMVGAMYAISDKLTLMGMTMFLSSEMDHITYQGMAGTTVLGEFTTETSGISDTRLTAMYKLTDFSHVNLGVSIPTGSIEETGQILTPMNETPSPRLPYPMQLGSGTWDMLPAITYANRSDQFGWGAQANAVIRLGENEYDYSLGNKFGFTSWGSYLVTNWLSASLRIDFMNLGSIDGLDENIMAPVQTANPDFHGGTRLDALLGINVIGQKGFVKNHRIAAEFGLPVYQDLNGPQLQRLSVLTLGYQYAF